MFTGKLRKIKFHAIVATGIVAGSSGAQAARYLVQLKSPGTVQTLKHELSLAQSKKMMTRDAFGRESLALPALFHTNAKVVRAFGNLDMVAVEAASETEIAALRNHPEVEYVEQEQFYKLPKLALHDGGESISTLTDTGSTWGLKAIKAVEAWTEAKTGARGSGARVMVLDSGIDRDHPALKNRLEAGKNFVNSSPFDFLKDGRDGLFLDKLSGFDFDPQAPAYDYWDQVGHGTHVAGTIAGENVGQGVFGVAPSAKVLMGKVCGKFGCSTLSIVNGVDWAIAQKVDVINMSLGGPMNSKAQEDALNRADAAGIVNIAAAGNGGNDSISYPGRNSSVFAVGAVDSTLTRATFSQYGPELQIVAPGVDVRSAVPAGSGREAKVRVTLDAQLSEVPSTSFVGSPDVDSPLSGALVNAGLGNAEDFNASVRGKIALIERGVIPFADKVKNAIAAGASAVVVFNNEPGLLSGAITQDGSIVAIPVVMIEKQIGEGLRQEIQAGRVPSAELQTMKTDYASFAGTSMASPHVAGVAALVRAANKSLTPAQVKDILVRTATKLSHDNSKNEYGKGLLNAQAAVAEAL